ncbi:MAG: nucleotide exchange factor GrpE [Actinomycetota bacterium]
MSPGDKTRPTRGEHRNGDPPTAEPPEEAIPHDPDDAPGANQGDPTAGAGDELAAARAEAAEYLQHLQRLQAEFENYRKRMLREQTRAVEFASEPIMSRLLEVLDEFELALVAAEQRPDFDKFLRGVEIVYAKLLDILRAEGLERIDATGRPFDPTEHEALFEAEGGEGEPYVSDVLRSGYRLKGRVIRPAGVKVARR